MNTVITGTSKGIGKALLQEIIKDPSQTVFCLSRTKPTEGALLRHSSFYFIDCDLSDRASVRAAVQQISENVDSIDYLINNAGYLVNKPFLEVTQSDLLKSYEVNFMGPYYLIQCILSLLLKSKAPHIVNVSSVGGVTGSSKFPGLSAYSSSKGALSILGECLAVELAPQGVSVNNLALGSVQTEMLEAAFPGYIAQSSPKQIAQYIWNFTTTALQVVSGKTHEVGKIGI